MKRLKEFAVSGLALTCIACAGVKQAQDRSDAALNRVERLGLQNYSLEAQVIDERATVRGYVSSQADRELALRAVRRDPEIREIDDFIEVRGTGGSTMTSAELRTLRASLLQEVSSYPLVGDLELNLESAPRGDIIISGHAPSEALVRRIESAAKKKTATGRNLVVSITAPKPKSDAQIKRDLNNALLANPEVDTDRFTVDVKNAVATIYGNFPNHRDIDRILSIALMVNGISDVRFEGESPRT